MPAEFLTALDDLRRERFAPGQWTKALASLSHAFSGVICNLEVIDRRKGPIRLISSHPARVQEARYIDEYGPLSPRVALGMRQKTGDIAYDDMVLSPEARARDPFYAEFLAREGLAFFISGVLTRTPETVTVISVQRGPAAGHVQDKDIANFQLALPGLAAAFEFANLAEKLDLQHNELTAAFDTLDDAVILLAQNGEVAFVNRAAETLFAPEGGFQLSDKLLEPDDKNAASALKMALAGLASRAQDAPLPQATHFVAHRKTATPLVAKLVPLPPTAQTNSTKSPAIAALFISSSTPALPNRDILQSAFGLTARECDLALALLSGIGVSAFAAREGISINTAYTHLRGLKDKTHTGRLPDLLTTLQNMMRLF